MVGVSSHILLAASIIPSHWRGEGTLSTLASELIHPFNKLTQKKTKNEFISHGVAHLQKLLSNRAAGLRESL